MHSFPFVSMGFKTDLAQLRIGMYQNRHLPAIALAAMEEGFYSPALVILAGKNEDDNSFLLRHYLDAALTELSVPMPEETTAMLEIAMSLAKRVVEGEMWHLDLTWQLMEGLKTKENTGVFRYPGLGSDDYEALRKLFRKSQELIDNNINGRFSAAYRETALEETESAIREKLSRWISGQTSIK